MQILAKSITGVSQILSVNVTESHNSSMATASIVTPSTSLTLGDNVQIDLGYSTGTGRVFYGIVKNIENNVPDDVVSITASDLMSRAVDYFIVASDPENPYTQRNIDAEDLVADLMGMAGLNNFNYDPTSFTFGIEVDVVVNLVTSYDFSRQVADILAWHLYCNRYGVIQFVDRKPYVTAGDTVEDFIIPTADIISVSNKISEENLRNRVVVYGAEGVYAEESASSPHLPAGFYKTVALATEIIDRQAIADQAAAYNLALLNRLDESLFVTVVGKPQYEARKIAKVSWPDFGITDELRYVYSCDHTFSSSGYLCTMELRK